MECKPKQRTLVTTSGSSVAAGPGAARLAAEIQPTWPTATQIIIMPRARSSASALQVEFPIYNLTMAARHAACAGWFNRRSMRPDLPRPASALPWGPETTEAETTSGSGSG